MTAWNVLIMKIINTRFVRIVECQKCQTTFIVQPHWNSRPDNAADYFIWLFFFLSLLHSCAPFLFQFVCVAHSAILDTKFESKSNGRRVSSNRIVKTNSDCDKNERNASEQNIQMQIFHFFSFFFVIVISGFSIFQFSAQTYERLCSVRLHCISMKKWNNKLEMNGKNLV